jgi:hypothetical protein
MSGANGDNFKSIFDRINNITSKLNDDVIDALHDLMVDVEIMRKSVSQDNAEPIDMKQKQKEKQKEYYMKNREKIIENQKEYINKNKDKSKQKYRDRKLQEHIEKHGTEEGFVEPKTYIKTKN